MFKKIHTNKRTANRETRRQIKNALKRRARK